MPRLANSRKVPLTKEDRAELRAARADMGLSFARLSHKMRGTVDASTLSRREGGSFEFIYKTDLRKWRRALGLPYQGR